MPANLQAYRAHLFGQNTEQGQSVDTHSASWVTHDSPTTEIIDPTNDGNPSRRSLIIWDTGRHYAATHRSFVLWQVRPLSHLPVLGRILNFHNSPNLPGGWDWGGGVSPVALDFTPTVAVDDKDSSKVYEGVTLTIEPTGDSIEGLSQRYHWTVVSLAQWAAAADAGQWISIVLDITWGSIHGSVAGAVKAYTFGNDTPVVNASGINTIFWNDYRPESQNDPFGPNPGGGQRGVSMWAGAYASTSSGLSASEVGTYDFTMPRVGATVQEALNDGTTWPITTVGPGQATHSYAGGGSTNLQSIASVDPALFALPPSLGGGPPPPPPPPPPAPGVFPSTPLLTTSVGPDEDPLSEGGHWSGPIELGVTQLRRIGNLLAANVPNSPSESLWFQSFAPSCEVWLDTIQVLPTTARDVVVAARIVNPGTSSAACYTFVWTNGTGFRYYKMTAGGAAFAQVGSTYTSHTLAAGEGIGLRVTGTGTVTLQGYYKSGGVWVPIPSGTDSTTPLNAGGKIGVGLGDQIVRAVGFGGGSLSNVVADTIASVADVPTVATTTRPRSVAATISSVSDATPTVLKSRARAVADTASSVSDTAIVRYTTRRFADVGAGVSDLITKGGGGHLALLSDIGASVNDIVIGGRKYVRGVADGGTGLPSGSFGVSPFGLEPFGGVWLDTTSDTLVKTPIGPRTSLVITDTGASISDGFTVGTASRMTTDPYGDGASQTFGVAALSAALFSMFVDTFDTYQPPAGETNVYYARLPLLEAQPKMSETASAPGTFASVNCSWHGQVVDPERGSFILVRAGGELEDRIGSRIRLTGRAPTGGQVVGYVHGVADLDDRDEVSVPRRLFMELGLPGLDRVPVTVETLK